MFADTPSSWDGAVALARVVCVCYSLSLFVLPPCCVGMLSAKGIVRGRLCTSESGVLLRRRLPFQVIDGSMFAPCFLQGNSCCNLLTLRGMCDCFVVHLPVRELDRSSRTRNGTPLYSTTRLHRHFIAGSARVSAGHGSWQWSCAAAGMELQLQFASAI
jgi:hypothetical protein